MEPEELVEYVETPRNSKRAEQEMCLNFTKADEKATVYTSIPSQTKRLLTHTDVTIDFILSYNTSDNTWSQIEPSDFKASEETIIFGMKGKVPIESLKVRGTPRSRLSYAQVISPQNEVNFGDDDD